MKLSSLVNKAKTSSLYLWILNRILWYNIPFNSPHKFSILKIDEGFVTLLLPYIRKNKNHINGVHACALATASEYATGLCLTTRLSASEYRIILRSIHMDYHYQGKTDISFDFLLENDLVITQILDPLKTQEAVFVKLIINGFDSAKKHVCTGTIEWQVKRWASVKTKI